MASPQTSKGYSRLANELMQAIYRFPFSGQEMRVILWVVRFSYGWSRKQTHPTSVRALAKDIFMPPATSWWVVRGLSMRGVLIKMDGGALRLNKNYDEWLIRGAGQLNLMVSPSVAHKASSGAVVAPKKKPLKEPSKRGADFVPPTIEEVRAYCLARKSSVDPDKFFHQYESAGWMTGRNKMTNWQSSVCYWERTNFPSKGVPKPTGKLCPLCEKNHIQGKNSVLCNSCGPYCRACGDLNARLKIVKRSDGTKTAKCRNGCARPQSDLVNDAILPSTKKFKKEIK